MVSQAVSLARAELLQSLAAGEITLDFQPQIDLRTGDVMAFEGVARWHHPKIGVLAPGLFLGLAAREGLLGVISRTLIAQAARAACGWRAHGFELDVAINLAVSDVTDPGFGRDILSCVESEGALPQWIVLEANEESLAYAGEPAIAGLEYLAGLGFKIALDAKGPPCIPMDKRARALFCQLKCGGSTMLSVATKLHSVGASGFMRRFDAARAAEMPVVAVGAETVSAVRVCRHLGFDRLQGHIISEPMSFSDASALLVRIREDELTLKSWTQSATEPDSFEPMPAANDAVYMASDEPEKPAENGLAEAHVASEQTQLSFNIHWAKTPEQKPAPKLNLFSIELISNDEVVTNTEAA